MLWSDTNVICLGSVYITTQSSLLGAQLKIGNHNVVTFSFVQDFIANLGSLLDQGH